MKPKPLNLEVEKEKIKREVMREEIQKIKEKFEEEELMWAFEWLMSESTTAHIVDVSFKKIKQRIKSACKFYLRYKDKPDLLVKEHPEYKKLFESESVHTYVCRRIFWQYKYDPEEYNEWLFKLAFNFKEGENEKI